MALIACTGSKAHLKKLTAITGRLKELEHEQPFRTEVALYRKYGLDFIPPELREGRDEVDRAARGTLPGLVELADIRGELHAHSTASDGAHSIEKMARAAQQKGSRI